jgi:amino acid adenylation domain-containing protein
MTISLPATIQSVVRRAAADGSAAGRWAHYLADAPIDVDLPLARHELDGDFESASVPVPVAASVVRTIRCYGASGDEGWLAAFATLLCRFTGQREVVIGSPTCDKATTVRRVASDGSANFVELTEALAEPGIDPLSASDFGRLFGRNQGRGPTFSVGYVRSSRPRPWPHARLSLLVPDDPDRQVRFGYDSRALSKSDATRLAEHFATLLTSLLARPDAPVNTRELLPPAERQRILLGFNDTAVEYTDLRGFADRIEEVAARTPTAVALSARSTQLTYAELDSTANQLAQYLIGIGVVTGDAVGLFLPRSIEAAVATLAILRTGAAVVPLDPADNDEWIAYMIRDSASAVVISDSGLSDRLPAGRHTIRAAARPARLVCLDSAAREIAAQPARNPRVEIEQEMLSHIVYTSGSTGVPKGARSTHRTLTNLINWMQPAYQITADSDGTWACAPGFAIGRVEWMPFLAAGARVHIADAITTSSASRMQDWLVSERITHTLLVTSFAQRVCALEWPRGSALRFMIMLGEPLHRWPRRTLPFAVAVSYGSTEASLVTSSYDAATGVAETSDTVAASELASTRPSAGRPVANTRIYLLDGDRNPVPLGAAGEIYIAGEGICSGYLNLRSDTRERFIANPLPEERSDVLFHTGDLGRWRPDGSLEVIGRQDAQTWVGGVRVEVGEVEAVINGLRGIREAAVLARNEDTGGTLIGYVVATNRRVFSADAVLAELRHRLPAHHVPQQLIELAQLPRLANGKLDRQALPAPAARIALVPDPAARFEPFPLTDDQLAQWSSGAAAGWRAGYGYWEWGSNGIDVERFTSAWQRVVERHDALRTVIRPDGSQQVLAELPEHRISVLDLRELPIGTATARAGRVGTDMTGRENATTGAPLWELRLTRMTGNRVRVHLLLSGLIADPAGSATVLVRDLIACYQNPSAHLGTPELRFRDYACSIEGAAPDQLAAAQRYWQDRAAELPPAPPLPWVEEIEGADPRPSQLVHRIGAQRWNMLKDRAAAFGVTPAGILLSAFGEVLRAVTQAREFTIAVPMFNRLPVHPGVSDVVGDFRTDVLVAMRDAEGSFTDRAIWWQRRLTEDTAHGSVSASTIVRGRRDAERGRFPVLFTSLLDTPGRSAQRVLGASIQAVISNSDADLDFQVAEVDGGVQLTWRAGGGRLPAGTLARMSAATIDLIDDLVDDTDSWQRVTPLAANWTEDNPR